MIWIKKFAFVLLTGLALLVLPATTGYAQECMTVEATNTEAAGAGFNNSLELKGSALESFIRAYVEITATAQSDDEIKEIVKAVSVLVLYKNSQYPVIVIRTFGLDGCALGGGQVPDELIELVMKRVEQKANN